MGASGGNEAEVRFSRSQRASAGVRLVVAVVAGLVVGLLTWLLADWRTGALVGWICAAVVFLAWTWSTVWPMGGEQTAAFATLEDPSRSVSDLVLLASAVGSMLAVALVIFHAQQSGPLRTALGVASIVASWGVLHTVFMLKYTRLYYTEPVGGIDFKSEQAPAFRDFAYIAFTVGMTYQVSDTDVGQSAIRMTVLQHALMAFVFGTVIIAVTINLLASLGH
jgi:uncharacterized membrane protein